MSSMNFRYTFLSNHNIHKGLCGLCFWASDPLIEGFYQNLSIKWSEAQKNGRTNFYECCDLTEKSISNVGTTNQNSFFLQNEEPSEVADYSIS